jgi:hypothetical protein
MRTNATLCLAAALILLAGCDTLYDKVNENLPEVGVSDGVLGFNGEEGVETAGSFRAVGGRGNASQTMATFTVERTFDDEGPTDFGVREITTSIGIALSDGIGLTITRPGDSLPEAIRMSGFSLSGGVSDSENAFVFPGLDAPSLSSGGDLGFQRATCETTEDSITCGYRVCYFNGTSTTSCALVSERGTIVFADRVRILSQTGYRTGVNVPQEESTERLLEVITEQNGVNTPNTGSFTFSFPTPVPAEDLEGATATLRLAETGTEIKANIL